ncbi:predicted protein [Histoplasma capsulatum H143]|uniref:Uncharacterized protein n=1 Tax=Ajellomyces capsulatus (strain H143) TaxID=544712 RepID=C6H9U8_AJECH|nr:predicted protein [Histoplasma capsulatum H143]
MLENLMCFGSHPKERLISKVPHLTKGLFTQCYCSQRTAKTEIVESNISGDVVGGILVEKVENLWTYTYLVTESSTPFLLDYRSQGYGERRRTTSPCFKHNPFSEIKQLQQISLKKLGRSVGIKAYRERNGQYFGDSKTRTATQSAESESNAF